MLVIKKRPDSYWSEVSYGLPDNEQGVKSFTFDAQFKYMSQKRLDEILESAGDGDITDPQVLDEVFLGWRGIKRDDDSVFEVNDANRAELLDLPGMRTAIINAFFASIVGFARKNSSRRRGTG